MTITRDTAATAPFLPLCRPFVSESQAGHVATALASNRWAGDGPFSERCAQLLKDLLQVRRVLLTTSCTHALEMGSLLLDLSPGDEVVLPTFHFVSGANAVVLRGARPVFVDVKDETLNLDADQVAAVVGPRTRALSILHYGGVACDLDRIRTIADQHRLAVIEDAAHALFGSWRGRPLGSFGDVATLSFHETKNLSCGEGGALLVNRTAWIDRAEWIREKGTNRSQLLRGEIDKYTWVEIGSSYLLSDLLAAVLLGQLESRAAIQQRRRAIWATYSRELAGWAAQHGIRLPVIPHGADHPAHLFFLLLPTPSDRDAFLTHMRACGIGAAFHFVPLHLSAMGQRLGYRPGQLPRAENLSSRLARLPLYPDLSEADLDRVLAAATSFAV